jgi:hypothetical protein
MRCALRICVVLLLLIAQGCVSTKVNSFIDPAFTAVSFQRVVVYANTADLEWRMDIEEELARDITTRTDARAIASLVLFSPTRQYTGQNIADILYAAQADSVLWVDISNTGVDKGVYCYQNNCDDTNESYASLSAFLLSVRKLDSADHDLLLVSRQVGQPEAFPQTGVAWTSTVESSSKNVLSFDIIWDRFSSKLVGALIKDGLLEEKE